MGAECRMSGMHFRQWGGVEPRGMAMIIMLIIQHSNNSLSVRITCKAHLPWDPLLMFVFATTYFSTLVRDIGGDEESNAEVPALHFDSGKFGVGLEAGGVGRGRKRCCTSYTLSIPSPFLFAPILGSSQH